MEGKEFWTRPKVEQLCKLWETKPSLYNPDNEFRDRWQKRRDSEEIAKLLGTTVEELLKKMKNLRTQHGRERRKTCFSPNDNCEVSTSKWYLLSVLKFLDKTDVSKSEINLEERNYSYKNDEANVEGVGDGTEEEDRGRYPPTALPTHVRNGHATPSVPAKRTRMPHRESCPSEAAFQDDAFDVFGKFVASELRLMESAHMQKLARLRIQQVLLDVQLGPPLPLPSHHGDSGSSLCGH